MTIRVYQGPPVLGVDVERADQHEQSWLRAAAHHARRIYPGELGELVHRELTAFADFGVRFAGDALLPRLAAMVLATPAPPADPNSGQTSAAHH